MTVWMRSVYRGEKRAITSCSRQPPHLAQAVQPKLTDAIQISRRQMRPHRYVGQQFHRARQEFRQRRETEGRRIRTGLDIEMTADPRQRVRERDRIARSGALV